MFYLKKKNKNEIIKTLEDNEKILIIHWKLKINNKYFLCV